MALMALDLMKLRDLVDDSVRWGEDEDNLSSNLGLMGEW